MIKIVIVLLCLPFIAFSQNDQRSKKSGNQLSKITSDTVKGKFDQIQIFYDQSNRVIRICQTTNKLSKSPYGIISQTTTHFLRTQDFEYADNNSYPTLRKRAIYRYDSAKGRDVITNCQVQYFKYKDGKRVGDSVFNSYSLEPHYRDGVKGDTILHNETANTDPTIFHKSEYQVFPNNIESSHDASHYASPPNKNTDNVSFGLNVKKAAYEVHQFNNDVFGYYFTFEQFDRAINPLKSLNIAPYIASEIFDFTSTDLDPEGVPINRWEPPCMPSNYLGWSYLNENNPISYTKNGSDGTTRHECPIKNHITIAYTYNTLKLPLRCAVSIKTIDLRNPGMANNADGIEKRHFNFTYDK